MHRTVGRGWDGVGHDPPRHHRRPGPTWSTPGCAAGWHRRPRTGHGRRRAPHRARHLATPARLPRRHGAHVDEDGLYWINSGRPATSTTGATSTAGSTTERAVLDLAVSLGDDRYRLTQMGRVNSPRSRVRSAGRSRHDHAATGDSRRGRRSRRGTPLPRRRPRAHRRCVNDDHAGGQVRPCPSPRGHGRVG